MKYYSYTINHWPRVRTRSVLDSKSVNEPIPLRDVILDKKTKKIIKTALSIPNRVFIVNQLARYAHLIVHTQAMQAREGDSRLLFVQSNFMNDALV